MQFNWFSLESLPRVAGHFNDIAFEGNHLDFWGWMLIPEQPFDEILLYLNGKEIGPVPRAEREDVAGSLPWVPHSGASGFRFSGDVGGLELEMPVVVELVGISGERPAARLSLLYTGDLEVTVPTPPVELVKKIGAPDLHAYRNQGAKVFADFLLSIEQHGSLSGIGKMLDWGCGCGRVAFHFLSLAEGPELYGCDIAPELIEWCQRNLSKGNFRIVDTSPPTPYPDGMFDLVIGSSVLTHLKRSDQGAWLREIDRVLAPGGLFLASTLGEYAAMRELGQIAPDSPFLKAVKLKLQGRKSFRDVGEGGIVDDILNETFKGVAPPDYYRNVFQTQSYTEENWAEVFDILEYVERGLDGYQDLVVMRKRS